MAVDTNFASLFDNLKLESPWLPPRPWESIPSESGLSHSNPLTSHSSLTTCLYDTSTVSEDSLVRLAMNALQGVESALICIEKLCAAFCSDSADRTFHRIPSLWNQFSSTVALGNILKSLGRSGSVVFVLRKFVDHFMNLNFDGNSIEKTQMNLETEVNQNDYDKERGEHPPYSLVNQAFAVAVGKVLDGYVSALDTLYASVGLRRVSKTDDVSSCSFSGVGCLTSVGHSEVTLLEVYLHSKVLRTQMEALGNICSAQDVDLCFSLSSFEDLSAKANLAFNSFPRGGDLLTFLYTQIKVADPVHYALLKFLFLRSCEPYCGFIRSWIYKANISDPYKEFILDYDDNLLPHSRGNAGISIDFPLATIRERDGVAVPCFLRDFLIPLLRAGQQLQVLMKLLELCDNISTWNRTYEDILPCWSSWSTTCPSYVSPLTFNKRSIEAMVLARNNYYKGMLEKNEHFLTKLDFRFHQVVPHRPIPLFVNNSGRSPDVPVPFATDYNPISSSTDERDLTMPVGTMDSEESSMTEEFSYLEDPLESSENSSLTSSEEEIGAELPHTMVAPEQNYLSALSFSSIILNDNSLRRPSKSEMSCAMESKSCEICDRTDLLGCFVQFPCKETNLSDKYLPLASWETNWPQTFDTRDTDSQHDLDWPLGGLPRNPFYVDRANIDETWLSMSGPRMKVGIRKLGVWEEDMSLSENALVGTNKDRQSKGTSALSNSFSFQPWKLKNHSNYLSMNPILTQKSFVQMESKPGERFCTEYRKPSFFNFTYVEDPCKACVEMLASSPRHNVRTELSILTDSAAICSSNNHEEGHIDDEVSDDNDKLFNVYSPKRSKATNEEDASWANVAGGSGWESLLGSSYGNSASITERDQMSLVAIPEIPLDFVIEKCLIEEILLQYRYVSKLTIKLLEEAFDLQEHLLALRRYHFMELADWADLFITSLRHHKWYDTGIDKRISEIQGALELSVQRSSCERDHNKGRLYVYTKGHCMIPLSASAFGIHSFDFLGLGYRVDWPVSIVLTPNALEIYAQIFSFLIQVKLAVFALSEIWCTLKDLLHLVDQNHHSEMHESELCRFALLMKMRHQVNHFVSNLQQYVHSQLSHVSWCRFLHALKHKVKDMMDLESVHMAYLTDSLHICFLSNETRIIATIVQSILQCSLDFRSCLSGSIWEAGSVEGGLSIRLSQINISQVLTIKATFDGSIKELYLCYLKSPRHEEFGLSHFWDYLNYNEYYSEVIGKEMGHNAFLL